LLTKTPYIGNAATTKPQLQLENHQQREQNEGNRTTHGYNFGSVSMAQIVEG
jgi:hypothetical protein